MTHFLWLVNFTADSLALGLCCHVAEARSRFIDDANDEPMAVVLFISLLFAVLGSSMNLGWVSHFTGVLRMGTSVCVCALPGLERQDSAQDRGSERGEGILGSHSQSCWRSNGQPMWRLFFWS